MLQPEVLTAPRVALALAVAVAVKEYLRNPAERVASADQCQEKYCKEIFVDNPLNTLMTDQSLGAGLGRGSKPSLQMIYRSQKDQLKRDQLTNPGVQLIARSKAPEAVLNEEQEAKIG